MLPFSLAIEECQTQTSQANIPCLIYSTHKGVSEDCTPTNIRFYNTTQINIQNLSWVEEITQCSATFNISTLGTYRFDNEIESGAITVVADIAAGGAILFFFFLINIGIFIIPFFVKFVENDVWNGFIGKAIWILGLQILALNTTMAADLADSAALGLNSIIFTFLWFFVKGIYVAMIVILFQAVIAVLKQMNQQRQEERMGNA